MPSMFPELLLSSRILLYLIFFQAPDNNSRAAVSSAVVCIPYARLWILLEKKNWTQCGSCKKLLIKIVSKIKIAFKQGMKCSVDTLTVFMFFETLIFILRYVIPQLDMLQEVDEMTVKLSGHIA